MLEDFAEQHAVQRIICIRESRAFDVEVLILELDASTVDFESMNAGVSDGAVITIIAKVIREGNVKRIAKTASDQQCHHVRVGTKFQYPTNIMGAEIVEHTQDDLHSLHAVADVAVLPRPVTKDTTHALQKGCVVMWITDESQTTRQWLPVLRASDHAVGTSSQPLNRDTTMAVILVSS
jgi:hypothetical protein